METILQHSSLIAGLIGAVFTALLWLLSLHYTTKQNKIDIAGIKEDFKEVRVDLTNLRIEVARQGEKTDTKIDMILRELEKRSA